MRLFTAVPLPGRVKEELTQIQEQLKTTEADLKLVQPQNLHFTLKFLGDQKQEKIPEIKQELSSIAEKHQPFTTKIQGLGAFPNTSYIKIVWAGIKENPKFQKLADQIKKSLNHIKKEEHEETILHITLARVKSGKNKKKLQKKIQQLQDKNIEEMKVNKIILYKSELQEKGPEYTPIQEYKLQQT